METCTVRASGLGETIDVEGRTYKDVMVIRQEMIISRYALPGGNYSKTDHYARGIGLVLTTSSQGDSCPLIAWSLQDPE